MLLLYYILPKRVQWLVLLAASIAFYVIYGWEKLPFLLASAVIAYFAGRRMEAIRQAAENPAEGIKRCKPVLLAAVAEGYTRITEYSHFPQQKRHEKTSLAYEYPLPYRECETAEPYYPILTRESMDRHGRYMRELEQVPNLICCGRLADFKYYNMDQALARALDYAGK